MQYGMIFLLILIVSLSVVHKYTENFTSCQEYKKFPCTNNSCITMPDKNNLFPPDLSQLVKNSHKNKCYYDNKVIKCNPMYTNNIDVPPVTTPGMEECYIDYHM